MRTRISCSRASAASACATAAGHASSPAGGAAPHKAWCKLETYVQRTFANDPLGLEKVLAALAEVDEQEGEVVHRAQRVGVVVAVEEAAVVQLLAQQLLGRASHAAGQWR